jgi:hypothetical protein
MNLYGFANGDPINFSDPFGLSANCLPCLGLVARFAGPKAFNFLAGRALPAIGALGRGLAQMMRPGAEPGADDLLGAAVSGAGIRTVQREGANLIGAFDAAAGEGRFITEMVQDGTDLILRGTHIEGNATLSEGLDVARRLGEELGVARVIVEGGRRTTGARAGQIPRPIILDIGND